MPAAETISQPRLLHSDDVPPKRSPAVPILSPRSDPPAKPPVKPTEAPSKAPPPKPDVPPPTPPPPPQSADKKAPEANADNLIDMDIFNQILELDEDEDGHDFSKSMVWDYFEQAQKTFKEMDEALEKKDLEKLSSLGHFLKGSSAALGLTYVQSTCEKIQHGGSRRDEEADLDLSVAQALTTIEGLLKQVKKEYDAAHGWLTKFFGDDDEQ